MFIHTLLTWAIARHPRIPSAQAYMAYEGPIIKLNARF